MYLKKLILLLGAFGAFHSVGAQQVVDNLCMQVIGSTGFSAEKLGKHYDTTLGEVMIATLTTPDGSMTVTQGFHQPECALVMVNTTDVFATWQLGIYPNPTTSLLHLQYEHPGGATLQARVWSVSGNLMADWQKVPSQAALDCSRYPSGFYFLEVKDQDSGQKTTIRFIKTSI